MARIIGIIVLILSILLFPPATLALISNNAVPGDATYPIKRTLEDGILLIASLNPTTKAWFSVERSNRRFTEAATLLGRGKEASETLDELVFQTNSAANEVVNIGDNGQKDALINQLSQSIEKYDKGLAQASGGVVEEPLAPLVTPEPVIATPVPTPIPTSQPTATPTTRPTVAPVAPPVAAPSQTGPSEKQKKELEEARKKLEEIKKKLEEEKKKIEEERKREREQKKQEEESRRQQQSQERESRSSQRESERKDNTRQETKEVIIETSEKNGLKKSD